MSLSFTKLTPIAVEDPVTQVNDIAGYAVLAGGSKVSFKAYTSTSIAASSIQFSCPPPAGNIIVDRSIHFTLPIRLTFTGNITTTSASYTPSTSLLNAGLDAPRAFPISGSLETLQSNINSDSVSIAMSDIIHALTRYNIDSKLRTKDYTGTPCYPDQSFNYQDLIGNNRNPLGSYGNSVDGSAIPRGGFPFTIVSNAAVTPSVGGTSATAVVDMVCTEPLFLSPYFFGCSCENSQGFYNVNSNDYNFSFLAQSGFRMWSHCPLVSTSGALQVMSNITGITVQFNGFSSPAFTYPQSFPQMQFKYITPNILTKQQLGPTKPVTYSYFLCQRYPTDIGTIAYGVPPTQFSSNNLQLNSIPRRIYFYARPSNNALQTRCDLTDCYLALSNVSVQWANQNTLLSSATQYQLYQINVKNHSSQDWMSWSGQGLNNGAFPPNVLASQYGGVGSVMCLEFSTDLQVDGDEAPGLSGQYQLQISANFQNMNSSGLWNNVPFTMYIVVVSEGTFTITGVGSAQHQEAVLSKMDILEATKMPGINYRSVERVNGGDFLSSLRDFGNKVNNFLKESKILSTIGSVLPIPGASIAANVARNLGYGGNDDADGDDDGAGCDGGVAVTGGRRLTKNQLRRLL